MSYSRDALPPVGDLLRPGRDGRRVDGLLLRQLPGHAVVVHHLRVRLLHGRREGWLVDELDVVEGDDDVTGWQRGGRGGAKDDGEDKLGRRRECFCTILKRILLIKIQMVFSHFLSPAS